MEERKSKSWFRFSIGSLLIWVAMFSLGFMTRNIASGLHPLYSRMTIPSSNSPIRAGESLSIECLSDPNLNRRVTVMADGMIDVPFAGNVEVRGLTTTEIETKLNKLYGKWIATPSIEVYRADLSESK